jgi:hypothetical protein
MFNIMVDNNFLKKILKYFFILNINSAITLKKSST